MAEDAPELTYQPTYFKLAAYDFHKPNEYGLPMTCKPVFEISRYNLGATTFNNELIALFDRTILEHVDGPIGSPQLARAKILKLEIGAYSKHDLLRIVIPGALYRWPSCQERDFYKVLKSGDKPGTAEQDESRLAEYAVELVGVRVQEIGFPGGPGNNYGLYYSHGYATPERYLPEILMQVRRARVLCEGTSAYVEYSWRPGMFFSAELKGLSQVKPERMRVETEKAIKGLAFLGLLEDGRGGSDATCDLTRLNEHRKRVYSQWKDAKDIWKRNRDRGDWMGLVKHTHPNLPSNLIEWLSGKPQISDAERSYLESRGMKSEPAVIALEHAARLCGASDYAFSVRYLERVNRAQKPKGQKPRHSKNL